VKTAKKNIRAAAISDTGWHQAKRSALGTFFFLAPGEQVLTALCLSLHLAGLALR
jgi:hypothetical protein